MHLLKMMLSQNSSQWGRMILNRINTLLWFDLIRKGHTILDIIESHITCSNHVNNSISFIHIRFPLLQGLCAIWIRSNQVKSSNQIRSNQNNIHQFTMIQNYANDIKPHQFTSMSHLPLCLPSFGAFYYRIMLRDPKSKSVLG